MSSTSFNQLWSNNTAIPPGSTNQDLSCLSPNPISQVDKESRGLWLCLCLKNCLDSLSSARQSKQKMEWPEMRQNWRVRTNREATKEHIHREKEAHGRREAIFYWTSAITCTILDTNNSHENIVGRCYPHLTYAELESELKVLFKVTLIM